MLRSSHAGYHGTPCFLSSAKTHLPYSLFWGRSRYHPVSACQASTTESPTLPLPKTFSRAALQISLGRPRFGLHQLPIRDFHRQPQPFIDSDQGTFVLILPLHRPQLATASLNFGVGRSPSFCIKSTIRARTPATQNFYQLLSFGCEFLKFGSISCFVFLWVVNRVSLDPVILCGAGGALITRPGGRATLSCSPRPTIFIILLLHEISSSVLQAAFFLQQTCVPSCREYFR